MLFCDIAGKTTDANHFLLFIADRIKAYCFIGGFFRIFIFPYYSESLTCESTLVILFPLLKHLFIKISSGECTFLGSKFCLQPLPESSVCRNKLVVPVYRPDRIIGII